MARTLDRNRDFGVIIGSDQGSFEQDGLVFDASGNEIVQPGTTTSKKKAAEKVVEPVTEVIDAEPSELDQQLAAQDVLDA
jgi:hypothetical protein